MKTKVQLSDLIEEAFSATGPLSQIWPEYTPRPVQLEYALDIGRTLSHQSMADDKPVMGLIEGETGVGKTLGYLIPALLHHATTGERVLISTHSLHLMKQVRETIKVAQQVCVALTNKKPTFGVRKGWGNFISPERTRAVADVSVAAQRAILNQAADWAENEYKNACKGSLGEGELPGDVDAFKLLFNVADLPLSEICYTGYINNDLGCNVIRSCFNDLDSRDVVISNHALLCIAAAQYGEKTLTNFETVIVDEADTLKSMAESIFNSSLSLRQLSKHAQSLQDERLISKRSLKKIDAIIENFVDLYPHAKPLTKETNDKSRCLLLSNWDKRVVDLKVQATASSFVNEMHTLLKVINEKLKKKKRFCPVMFDAERKFESLNCSINNDGPIHGEALISWSPVRFFPSVHVSLANQGRKIKRLWCDYSFIDKNDPQSKNNLKRIVLTSATLTVPNSETGDLTLLNGELGISSKDLVILTGSHTPRRYGTIQSYTLADPSIPKPTMCDEILTDLETVEYKTNPIWLDYCANMIRYANAGGGRTLVLTLSHKNSIELGDRLNGALLHREGEKVQSVMDQYKNDDNAVLITAGSWQGLDLPGFVDNLVITRMPIFPIDNIVRMMIENRMKRSGGTVTDEQIKGVLINKSLNLAKLVLRQGFGRGLRKPDDKLKIWIADPRFPIPANAKDVLVEKLNSNTALCNSINRFKYSIPKRFREGFQAPFKTPRIFTADGRLIESVNTKATRSLL